MEKRIMETLELFKNRLEEKGMNVFGITARGSMNQGLFDDASDVDTIAIIIPTLKDLVLGKTISTNVKFEEGDVLLNDPITLAKTLSKGNASFIEAVNSEFQIGDFSLFKRFEVKPMALMGMIKQKRKTVFKERPGNKESIDMCGFDTKDLVSSLRLSKQLKAGLKAGKLPKTFIVEDRDREVLMGFKRTGRGVDGNILPKEVVELFFEQIEDVVKEAKKLKFEQVEFPEDELVELVMREVK